VTYKGCSVDGMGGGFQPVYHLSVLLRVTGYGDFSQYDYGTVCGKIGRRGAYVDFVN
jgi:hypothetical protein